MKKKLVTVLLFIIAIVVFDSCKSDTSASDDAAMAKKGMVPVDGNTFKTDNGWGYTISVNHKVFIKQTVIPAVEGNKGFATQEDAARVAQLVINKIANQQKPTIKKEDLKRLGIIK